MQHLKVFLPRRGGEEPIEISGKVTDDDGEPLIGATIKISGSNKGTVTDLDGNYKISVQRGQTIEVLYLGYATETAKVGNATILNFSLTEDTNVLDDVVVIGYGTSKKTDLTGSVVNVKMEDIKTSQTLSIDNALQGRIAGADFMSTSGEPGATTSIRIRGTRSITASNEPLIIVDGIMDAIHDLNDINSDDIASISVLKDASSTAIYGSRGANGVIIVTTKHGSGSENKENITFKADFGFAQIPTELDIMNASEFAQFRNDIAYFGDDLNKPGTGSETPLAESSHSDPLSYGEGTDWIKEISRTAFIQNYALSLSGKSKLSSHYVSLSYNDSQGVIQDSGQKRFTGRINIDRQIFKWLKLGYVGTYTFRHNDQSKASIGGTAYYSAAMYLSPLLKPGDSFNPYYDNGRKINTPRALIDLNTNYNERHSSNHSFVATLTPVKNLTVKSTFSYYFYQRHGYRYYPSTLPMKTEGEGGEAYRGEWDDNSMSSETTVNYDIEADKHKIGIMGGLSAYRFTSHSFELTGKGYTDDEVKWNNMNAVLDKETYNANTSYSKTTKMSYFARLNYNYDSRYYLTVTGRVDQASNFAANKKSAFFPSAALRWNASNESWLKNADWIDDLSLRLSVGVTGNDAIASYRSLAALSSTTGGYVFDGSQPVAYYRSRLDSPDLTWEKTLAYNLAVDWSMFKNRLNITAEAYLSKTSDLLLYVQLPTHTGYESHLKNLGRTSNKGIELTIDSRNIVTDNFSWSTTLTMSHNTQLVEDIGTEDFVSAMDSPGNNPYMIYGYVNGYPLNSLWGFRYGGVWKSEEEIARNTKTNAYVSATTPKLGDIRFYDLNHDGSLNRQDLAYCGNADPYLYGGLMNSFYYKGFTLNVYFAYSFGGKIYNYSEFYMAGTKLANQYRYMLDGWHPERNPDSDIPRAGYKADTALPSDFMIHDASFIRLKNVSLSYRFDLKSARSPFRDITLSVIGDNLFLWKKYNGFDPDVSTESSSSTLRRVDLGAYPKARTITFSIQLRY